MLTQDALTNQTENLTIHGAWGKLHKWILHQEWGIISPMVRTSLILFNVS